ncbi:hypothetical protein ABPG73_017052 [Tetrahymena malaccensis]
MNYCSFVLISSILIITLNAHSIKRHVCNHDADISYNIPSDYFETFQTKFGKRFLQSQEDAQPLRLTYDITQLFNNANGAGMTDAKRNYIVKILKAAQIFFKNLIQIIPRSTPIKSQGLKFCGQAPFIVNYPPELLKNGQGIHNSDMHLLVTYFNDNNSSSLASAEDFQSYFRGYCLCIDGYAGQDCSVNCQHPNVYDGNSCISQCPTNKFKNPDNTCKPSCPKGYYKDYQQQSCLLCDTKCSACTGSSPTECSSCNLGYELNGTTCISHICDESCGTCFGSRQDQCTSCQPGYTLKGQICISNCHASCKTCSVFNDPNFCTSCEDGFYLSNNQCIKCPSQCATCEIQSLQGSQFISCKICNNGYVMIDSTCLQCTYPCAECQENQTNCTICERSHLLYGNICEPTCDESCQNCSKLVDPNSCTSCYPGYYLDISNQSDQGSCKQCQSNCLTCINGQSCDSCIQDYLLQNDGSCTPICDVSCLTCSQPNNKNSCLSCSAPYVLQNNLCQQCANGLYYENGSCVSCSQNCQSCQNKVKCDICLEGYQLDKNFNCVQIKSCHQTCLNCIGDSYFQCTSCPQNRQLVKLDISLSFGICQCPENTTDYNDSECPKSNTQKNIQQAIIGSFAGLTISSIFTSLGLQNPLMILAYFQLSQGISYFNLLNAKQSVGFDEDLGIIQFANFDFYQFKTQDKVSNQTRILSTQSYGFQQSNNTSLSYNPKIILYNKSNNFLQNSLVILLIQGVVWIMSITTFLINRYMKIQINFIRDMQKNIFISFPLIIYVLCSQEMWLCILYQFQLYQNGQSDIQSFAFSLIAFFYMIAILIVLFYKIEYKKVLKFEQPKNSQKEVEQLQNVNLNQNDRQNFNFINKYVKQENFATRNIVQIIVLQQMIISVAIISENANIQITLFIVCYVFFSLFIGIIRPLKQVKQNLMLLSIYFVNTILSIIYAVSINYQNDPQIGKALSLTMLSIIILVFVILFCFQVIILLCIAYKYLKKNNNNQIKNHPSNQTQKQSQACLPQINEETGDGQTSQISQIFKRREEIQSTSSSN